MQRNLTISVLFLVFLLGQGFKLEHTSAGLFQKSNQAIEKLEEIATSFCILNSSCYKKWYLIYNYCCSIHCCSFVGYIFSDE